MLQSSSNQNITNIKDTPLSVSIYSVKDKPLQMHDAGTLEIIFCLSGTVDFSYAYEEFTLRKGEYISVDRDAYYLHSEEENLCASFYLDLTRFVDKYPHITHMLFVCEGCSETTMPYPTEHHDKLRGMLIALLKYILENHNNCETKVVNRTVGKIIDMFVHHFDIMFFHTNMTNANADILSRNWKMTEYIDTHLSEKITLKGLASHLGLTKGYLSEYMRKFSVGFREIVAYTRANRSEWYLINTNDTIIEISEKCGFSDAQYYYKAFKKWYRCTPRQFRDKYIKQSHNDMVYYEPEIARSIVNDLLVEHYIDLFLE